jgi:hypothetical protein
MLYLSLQITDTFFYFTALTLLMSSTLISQQTSMITCTVSVVLAVLVTLDLHSHLSMRKTLVSFANFVTCLRKMVKNCLPG